MAFMKVYRKYDDIPEKERGKFDITKHFSSQRQYERFLKWQNVKSTLGFYYLSVTSKVTTIGDGKTVHFSWDKKL